MTSEFCVIGAEPVVEPGLPVVGEQASAFLHCPNGWQDPQAHQGQHRHDDHRAGIGGASTGT